MKQRVLLACLTLIMLFTPSTLGQGTEIEVQPTPPPQQALAAIRTSGQVPPEDVQEAVEHLRDAMLQMGRFNSLGEADSIAALVRLALTTMSIGPGATVVVTGIEPDPQNPEHARNLHIAATLSLSAEADVDRLVGAWPAPDGDGLVFIRESDAGIELCFTKVDFKEGFLRPDALDPFASHTPESAGRVELMLDLEGLRRAWPQSLADGPARRVVAVTGLANARKIHVHVPESGAVRLAYSSRALPPEDVTTRSGPSPDAGDVGARWPALFDAGLRTYAVALEPDDRQAFGRQFQQWMGQHGNRLRGIVQAVEIGVSWSIDSTETGLRTRIVVPVREGVEIPNLTEAIKATLTGAGFSVEGDAGTLSLPPTVADAFGGSALTIQLEQVEQGEGQDADAAPARIVVTIE